MLPASEYDDTCPFDRISANNERAGGKEVPVPSECVIYGGASQYLAVSPTTRMYVPERKKRRSAPERTSRNS